MKGDYNEQGSLIGQDITQVCCNEHPPTGVLIPGQKHTNDILKHIMALHAL